MHPTGQVGGLRVAQLPDACFHFQFHSEATSSEAATGRAAQL